MATRAENHKSWETEILAVYRVAVAERLGLDDEELILLRTGNRSALSPTGRKIFDVIEQAVPHGLVDGRISGEPRSELQDSAPELLTALDFACDLIQPLAWPDAREAGDGTI